MLSSRLLRFFAILLVGILLFYPVGRGLSSDGGAGPLYYTYDQLQEDVQAVAAQYPGLVRVSVESESVEAKDILAVTVGNGEKNILITGAIHGSEWITAPVLLETIRTYAQGYYQGLKVKGQSIRYILDNYSLTFMPMVNPDGVTLALEGADAFPHRRAELLAMNPRGLDFSRWKANIQGVDINRNFDVRWGEPVTETVAPEPWYAFYGGPSPESEPETQAVADWVRANNPELFLDYHSYGEVIFWYYLQKGAKLTRDRNIAAALAEHTGYWLETVNPSVRPSATSTYWGSEVIDIPSICVEVGGRPPHLLTLDDLPGIMNQVKYLPLVTIMKLPGYQAYIPVQSVTLPKTLVADIGSTQQLGATVFPANASNKQVTWSSSNTQVATVNSQGVVTPLEAGSTVITATSVDGGFTAATGVTVYRPLTRLKDANRYSTAVAVSKAGWEKVEAVVLARGDDFADGLAGVPLAHQLEAPLLLTQTGKLPVSTREEIQRLQAKTVYILGGTGAIGQGVAAELAGMGLEVVRISGSNRFDTAAKIARMLAPTDTAVVAYGLDFPDALTVASHAAARGYPILLTAQKDLTPITADAIAELGIKNTIVVGGTAVVGTAVEAKLPKPIRIKGENRYATAAEIARYFDYDDSKLLIASGLDFADAMTGAVLAAREGRGILLTANHVPLALEDYITTTLPREVVLLGGDGAISQEAEIALSNLLEQLKGVTPK